MCVFRSSQLYLWAMQQHKMDVAEAGAVGELYFSYIYDQVRIVVSAVRETVTLTTVSPC